MIDSLLSFILGLVWIGLPIGFVIGKWTAKRELHKAERESYLRGREDGYKTAIAVRNDKIVAIMEKDAGI